MGDVPQRVDDPTLPSPWQKLSDPNSGSTYFWNQCTSETTYDRPGSLPQESEPKSGGPRRSRRLANRRAVHIHGAHMGHPLNEQNENEPLDGGKAVQPQPHITLLHAVAAEMDQYRAVSDVKQLCSILLNSTSDGDVWDALAKSRAMRRTEDVSPGFVHIPFTPAERVESVVCYLGPTNAGKTYEAIEFLASRGRGCYAGPLRMLALEVWEKLRERLGDSMVGLVTGEEAVNPTAPIVCTTVECAPMGGDTLVLDEVHWITDEERGPAWTRLLAAQQYAHYRICGAKEAEGLLREVFAGERGRVLEFRSCTRRSTLVFGADAIRSWDDLLAVGRKGDDGAGDAGRRPPSGATCVTCVVAFSRAKVLGIAAKISKESRGSVNVSVLYGGMPPQARLEVAQSITNGDVDVVVTTDVIGHGINLPIDRLVFAETSKYDGRESRQLKTLIPDPKSKLKNRLHTSRGLCYGVVHFLDMPGLQPYRPVVENFVKCANGHMATDLKIETGYLSPSLRDLRELGGSSLHLLRPALAKWSQLVCKDDEGAGGEQARRRAPRWARAMPVNPVYHRLSELENMVARAPPPDLNKLPTLDEFWKLATLPVTEEHFPTVAKAAVGGVGVGREVVVPCLEDVGDAWGDGLESMIRLLEAASFALNALPARVEVKIEDEVSAPGTATPARLQELLLYTSDRFSKFLEEMVEDGNLCPSCRTPKTNLQHRLCSYCFYRGFH